MTPHPAPRYTERLKIAFHYLLPQLYVTRLAGRLAECRCGALTHFLIRTFAQKYNIDMSEAAKPDFRDYATFNEFFTRPLKDGARPTDETAGSLCFPADGKISGLGPIEQGMLLQAKGRYYSLNALLAGDEETEALFTGGTFVTTYLSPRDYHRVHMPCRGILRKMIYVPGELFSVNPFSAEHIPDLFARNERVICLFDTDFGPMVQILVGATVTASISTVWAGIINPPRPGQIKVWHYPAEGSDAVILEKGAEAGAFRLGSTVINLFAPGRVTPVDGPAPDTPVRVGRIMAYGTTE